MPLVGAMKTSVLVLLFVAIMLVGSQPSTSLDPGGHCDVLVFVSKSAFFICRRTLKSLSSSTG
eukprot:9405000-Prorocentrum_lima.AAC.1